jgi:hypothetical protein
MFRAATFRGRGTKIKRSRRLLHRLMAPQDVSARLPTGVAGQWHMARGLLLSGTQTIGVLAGGEQDDVGACD